MVSALVDEERGFGFPMTAEEVARVNTYRLDLPVPKPPIELCLETPTGSPGLIFFNYGSAREGWWDCERFCRQVHSYPYPY
jgi:hypothetical protein